MLSTCLILALFSFQDSHIERVRQGYLDHNTFGEVGLVFEHYRYFESFKWRVQTEADGQVHVIFDGVINDEEAVTDFYDNNKYAFYRAFKAIQLEPYYGLTKDKQKLRYRIDFIFEKDGGFAVGLGFLGIMDKAGNWTDKKLEDKSLLAVLDGIYSNENPYVSLVTGLPFK